MFIIFFLIPVSQALAQESTIYVSVVATRGYVVGTANPPSGLFYQRPSEDTTWHHTGSNNIRAFGLAVHAPARGQLIYIASGNGVHKTSDGGKNWKITTGWEITEALWVSIDPKDPQTVYTATAYGISKTSDGGATWKQMNTGLTSTFTSSVIVDHANSNVIYCSTEDGVFGSKDGAQSWTKLGLRVANVRVIAQNPRDSQMLAAGTDNNGIYISRDSGKVWAKSEAGLDHATFYAIAFDPNHTEVIYAGGYVTGVYKSIDGGRSWKRYQEGLKNLNIHSVAVDRANSNRVYAGTMWGGIFRSDDGGVTWRQAGLSGSQVWAISIQPF
ncbi:MAG: WD40/YVTN/BNR-like repeat-containing protein [bacterium]